MALSGKARQAGLANGITCCAMRARGALDYAKVRRAKMPIGSGTMESAIRRVVNLRLKGAGIFWHEDHAEQMLLLTDVLKVKTGRS